MNDNNTCNNPVFGKPCRRAKHHTGYCTTADEKALTPAEHIVDANKMLTPAGGEVELLPCAFCQSSDVLRFEIDGKKRIQCRDCGACIQRGGFYPDVEWNTRRAESPDLKAVPALSTPDDVLEIMRELNEDNARLTAEVERLSKELETARNDAQGMTDLWREAQKGQ